MIITLPNSGRVKGGEGCPMNFEFWSDVPMLPSVLHSCESSPFLISHSLLAFQVGKNSGWILLTSSFLTVANNFFLFYSLHDYCFSLHILLSYFTSSLHTPGVAWSVPPSSPQQPQDFGKNLWSSYSWISQGLISEWIETESVKC